MLQRVRGCGRIMDLKDKRALITGGTSGMGIATAEQPVMAEKGVSAIIAGRDGARGAEHRGEDPRGVGTMAAASFIAADFSEMSEVGALPTRPPRSMFATCSLGRCRHGSDGRHSTRRRSTGAIPDQRQGTVLSLTLLRSLRTSLPAAADRSSTSQPLVVLFGQPGLAAYGASRAAVELLTKAWAVQDGPQNVRVNAVAPGPTLTRALEPRLAMAHELRSRSRSVGSPGKPAL